METTFRGVIVARTDSQNRETKAADSMVFVEITAGDFGQSQTALRIDPDSNFRVGDEVAVTIRKVSSEVPTDVE